MEYTTFNPPGLQLLRCLELNVDEKFYLSEKVASRFNQTDATLTKNIIGTVVKTDDGKERIGQRALVYNPSGIIGTLTATDYKEPKKIIEFLPHGGYRLRKLTPLECWRLMGQYDEDFYKAKNSGISDSQLYKQAGNSIVVNVLESIFTELIFAQEIELSEIIFRKEVV